MPYSMLDEAMMVQAYADDPASAESEWFGAFRSGLESLTTIGRLRYLRDRALSTKVSSMRVPADMMPCAMHRTL